MENTKRYEVLDFGVTRPDVAGARRRIGDVLELTPSEAEFEVSRGTIADVELRERAAAKEEKKAAAKGE